MATSGIRSPATYHKCLKELIATEYIMYEPSFDKHIASRVTLVTAKAVCKMYSLKPSTIHRIEIECLAVYSAGSKFVFVFHKNRHQACGKVANLLSAPGGCKKKTGS
jgi:hypothetical protein